MSRIDIREANATDHQFIVQAQLDMALETEGRVLDPARVNPGVAAVLEDAAKGKYYIAEVDSHPVGSLLVTFEWSDWRNGNFYWIQSVFVLVEYRKRGVFRALYNYVTDIAKRQGCGVRLYVDEDNHSAQQTYERLGMTRTNYAVFEQDFVYESHR